MTNSVGTTLDELPSALALNGGELVLIYQQGPNPLVAPWITLRCTTAQIAELAGGGSGPILGGVSMRQLFAAMADQGVMVTAFEQLPADITNTYNIAWTHAYRMTISDPFISGFLQAAIGYDDAQMTLLFLLALTFPV